MAFRRGQRHMVRTEKWQHVPTATVSKGLVWPSAPESVSTGVPIVTVRQPGRRHRGLRSDGQTTRPSANDFVSPRTPPGIAFSVLEKCKKMLQISKIKSFESTMYYVV
jgi:hypothetical protein